MDQGNKHTSQLKQAVSAAHEYAFKTLHDEIEAHEQFLKQVQHLLRTPAPTYKELQTQKEAFARLIQQTERRLKRQQLFFSRDRQAYVQRVESVLLTLPEMVEHTQARERYYVQAGDPAIAYLIKPLKRTGWQLSRLPRRIANLFRKQKQSIGYGRQRTALRGIAAHVCLYQLPQALLPVYVEWFQLMNQQFAAVKQLSIDKSKALFPLTGGNSSEDVAALLEALNAFAKRQSEYITQELLRQHSTLAEDLYAKAGTWELSNRRFRTAALRRKQRRLDKRYRKALLPHNRLATALLSDWRTHESLIKISCEIKLQEAHLLDHWQALRQALAQTSIEGSCTFMHALEQEISTQQTTSPQAINEWLVRLQAERQHMESRLRQLLDTHKPGEQLTAYELYLDDFFKKQTLFRPLIPQINFRRGIAKKVSFVNLNQLIQHESLPAYRKALKEVKTELARALTKVESRLLQNWEAVLFNFHTVTERLQNEKEEVSAKDVLTGALQRAAEQIRQAGMDFQQIVGAAQNKLQEADRRFVERLLEMEQIDRLLGLQLRIRKAQARERLRHYRQQAWDFLVHLPAHLLAAWRTGKTKVIEYYHKIAIRLGLLDNPLLLEIPIADFLATASARVQSLPFIYRKLFEPQPLDNWRFYIPRPEAEQQVKKAFENWQKGGFAPIVVTAEAGNGKTTFLNYVKVHLLPATLPVHIIDIQQRIEHEIELVHLYKQHLGLSFAEDTPEALCQALLQLPRCCIIVENMEYLFTRQVDGFSVILQQLKIMSQTNSNVFWIGSCHHYSWQYLQKTKQVDDFLAYPPIHLHAFKKEEIEKLILQKHQISGYELRYQSSAVEKQSRKFQNLDYEAQQALLKDEFFKDLQNIIQGNLRIAQLLWVNAIEQFDDQAIYITSLKGIHFSFLKEQSMQKLLVMRALLLHGAAHRDTLARCLRLPAGEINTLLLLLMDDGIVLQRPDGYYHLHPILYQAIVQVLKSRNIIH
ncbi:MAG: hypothetical protein KatS3mg033_0213 [Thermonema sp.]|uniref:hypothetical protein n=1 Tax=Thermonema sp. TaxID=2231181 RepID=UPI0021DE1E15|nr:hypothetical protein [Thermonema sp.]GIV38413.1 MAG: hypothetical protein KatS3mg033_0213 [Thermonema sp.]